MTGILVLKPVRRVLLLAGLVFAGMPAGSALAASPCGTSGQFSQSGATATCTYSNPGTEDTFTVPAGISSVSVSAFGAPGGAVDLHTAAAAGLGAKVVNTGLPVAVGSTLSVDVGQAGPPAPGGICFSPPGAGGLFDGGGGNECSGGGGGSSALLTTPRASAQLTGDPATDGRLLVAGGGGGAGTADGANGGSAGDSAVTGAGSGNCDAPGVGAPGGIGPTDGTAGGGAGCGGGADGTASGGGAGSSSGGGGGGGWFGGGGGGQGSTQGGGGGGSSYGGAGPAGGISIVTAASTDTPQVVISYTASAPTAWITTPADGASFAQGQVVNSSFSCTEGAGGPGIASCTDSNGASAPVGTLDTSTAGAHTYTVMARSNDGLTGTATINYTVVNPPAASPPTGTFATPPSLSGVSQSHHRWRLGSKLASFAAAAKPPVGTTFRFTLNDAGTVRFAFTQLLPGRKVNGRCVAQTARNRSHKACTRSVPRGSVSFSAGAGPHKLAFQGRLGRTSKLKPGTYNLTITATNAAGQRATKTLSFTIVKG